MSDTELLEERKNKYTFNIESGYMVVSDPCYDIHKCPNECFRILTVEKGEWEIKSIRKHYDFSGDSWSVNAGRICRMTISNKKKHPIEIWEKSSSDEEKNNIDRIEKGDKLGRVSVDSGQMSFCDLEKYRDDNGIEDNELSEDLKITEQGDRFYSKMCKITEKDVYGVFENGCVTSSGWGDGCYNIYGKISKNKSLVEITIDFY